MWDNLREQVAVEREQLRRLLETYQPLLEKCAATPPDAIELSALAAMLHSFYNGVENIFKRTTLELDGVMPGGEHWHKELLDAMTQATRERHPFLSLGLAARLKEYMEFRHVFRHAYTLNLRWDRMRSLVLGCEETLGMLEREVAEFLRGQRAGGD